jgi:hypothetical protein
MSSSMSIIVISVMGMSMKIQNTADDVKDAPLALIIIAFG